MKSNNLVASNTKLRKKRRKMIKTKKGPNKPKQKGTGPTWKISNGGFPDKRKFLGTVTTSLKMRSRKRP